MDFKLTTSLQRCLISGGNTERSLEIGYIAGFTDVQYISTKMVGYLARAAGWTSPEDAEELRDALAARQADVDRLQAELATAGIDAEATAAARRLVSAFGEVAAIISDRELMGRLVSAAPGTRPEDPRAESDAVEENV